MTREREKPLAHALRWLCAALIVAGFVLLAMCSESEPEEAQAEERYDPLPEAARRCPTARAEAAVHARTLEQSALARWERTPFALQEAPRAVQLLSEAEVCYGAAHARAERLRVASSRAKLESEILRRYTRARLLLRMAMRSGRAELAREQVAALLALLSRAPAQTAPLRSELEQLARGFEAEQRERAWKGSRK